MWSKAGLSGLTTAVLFVLGSAQSGETEKPSSSEKPPLTSPCPDVFRLDSQQDGFWNGSLLLNSPHVLKGIFIKLYFDQDVDELTVQEEEFAGEIVNLDDPANRGFLIKNKDEIFGGKRTEKIVKISVSYSGQAPNLKELRINGYTICPNINSDRIDFYPSDPGAAASNYLESIAQETGLFFSTDCGRFEGNNNRFPWQAAVFTTDGQNYNYTCEAVLISPRYLATSAHCVSYLRTRVPLLAEKLAIYFGVDRIDQVEKRQPFLISRVILYPGYQPQNLFNDIALLELKNPAEIKQSPVCLPESTNLNEKIQEILVGYKIENSQFAEIGSAVLNRIIPQENCFKTEAFKTFLGDATYCASYVDDKLQTIGDSGSGAYARINDRYQLQGILTLGGALLKDNSRNILFTDVYKYDKWLRKRLNFNSEKPQKM